MPNKRYKKGYEYELRIMKTKQKKGFYCIRSAGSHGFFDVIAINPETNEIHLIQAKAGKVSQSMKKLFFEDAARFNGVYRTRVFLWQKRFDRNELIERP